jgi:hypothetical protein
MNGPAREAPHRIHTLDILRDGKSMSKIEEIEEGVKELSAEELSVFRAWFSKFDADAWDRQFEADVKAGRLDALAERALREHAEGRSTKL